jgi:hypothetical protein
VAGRSVPPFVRVLGVLALLDVVQLGADFASFRDGTAVLQILALDVAALPILAIAAAVGRVIGKQFASVVALFVGVGIPVALFGAVFDALGSAHLSSLSGCTSLVAGGAGLCLATRENRIAPVLGVIAVGIGVYALVSIHDVVESAMIAAPLVVVAAAGIGLGLRGRTAQTSIAKPSSP